MAKLTLVLNDAEYAEVAELKELFAVKTMTKALKNAVKYAISAVKNDGNSSRTRAQLTSFVSKDILSESKIREKDFYHPGRLNEKKVEKAPLDPNWLPPQHLREDYCTRYGLVYHQALTLFKDMMMADGQKKANFDATWNVMVMKGALKQVNPENDNIEPEDTMAFQYGNCGTTDYLRRSSND